MAKNKGNDLTYGLSGRMGKMISYRQIDGETEAFRRSNRKRGPGTAEQVAHRERFVNAAYYGKSVMADPVKKAVYDEKASGRKSAYNLAVSDFMKAPEIKSVSTGTYRGQAGDPITIRAIDDFKVSTVRVSIMDAGGALLEQGSAVALPGGIDWVYTATIANPLLPGSKIIISARDLAGNVTVKETEL